MLTITKDASKDGPSDGIKVERDGASIELIPGNWIGRNGFGTVIFGDYLNPQRVRVPKFPFTLLRSLIADAAPRTGIDPELVNNLILATGMLLSGSLTPNALAFPDKAKRWAEAHPIYLDALAKVAAAMPRQKPPGSPYTADIGRGARGRDKSLSPPTAPEIRQSVVVWGAQSPTVIRAFVGPMMVQVGLAQFDAVNRRPWRGSFWLARDVGGFAPSERFVDRRDAEIFVENHWRSFLERTGLRPVAQ